MAELSVFTYSPGDGGLYACDGRFKLLALLILTVTLTGGRLESLTATSAIILAGLFITKVPTRALLRDVRWFGAFLVFIWVVRALGTPGQSLLALGPFQLTREGAVQGSLICWRMMAVLMAGLLFIRTTRMAEVRAATAWLLRPVPYLNRQQTATMLGLLVRFIPLILNQARQIRQAQQARGIEGRRHPIFRLKAFAFPLLRNTVIRSDRIAVAMAARGYTGETTPFAFTSRPRDWALLGLSAALAAVHLFY
jgi:energy-coupling factor transporter transmembrane protein EcfT